MKESISPNKIAIVTGGGSGLGFAIAERFVKQNIFTIITGRNQQKLDEAKATLGDLCLAKSMDMSQLDQIPLHVKSIVDTYGKIDILVNNAGVNLKKDMYDVTDQEFQQIILTNLTSVFTLSREVSKGMIDHKSGAIINISSMTAHYGIPKVIAYTASKTAIEGMTRSMAVELSPLGIRVNCVAPGFIKTNMSSTALDKDPERKNRVLARTPMGKLGLPEDVANAVYFLASDEAKFITGSVLTVDGGNSIGF